MTFDRMQQQFRKHVVGALSVTAMLIVVAIGATFLLTRGLVAPMHRLMRAARAVGAGQARRVRAGELLRRARPAHAHVQPHDPAARRVAGGGGHLSAHARGQGRPADEGAGGRHRARVQARAARHPDRTAEPRAPQPAAEADHRAVAAQRHARRVPVPRLRPLQANQRHARPRCGRPAAAGGRAAAHHGRARVRHRRAAGRRRVRRASCRGSIRRTRRSRR